MKYLKKAAKYLKDHPKTAAALALLAIGFYVGARLF